MNNVIWILLVLAALAAFLCGMYWQFGDVRPVTEWFGGKTFVQNLSPLFKMDKAADGVISRDGHFLYASGSRMPLSAVVEKSQMAGGVGSRDVRAMLSSQLEGKSEADHARDASDKNQLMDALLNQPEIPADYGETMVSLCRDKSQDLLTRDFAVQHIGLYAQALSRRGAYNPKSAEAMSLRDALFDAAGETRTVVAAAAFRALSDMSAFDAQIDTRRLDSTLAACAGDAVAAPAARSMAVQLCGERRVNSARPALERILASPDSPEILRRSASRALARLR